MDGGEESSNVGISELDWLRLASFLSPETTANTGSIRIAYSLTLEREAYIIILT
jgi:hypothetical protein